MQASFVLDSSELDYSFIDKLRSMFKDKRVELFVAETDDTAYLSTSKANKEILLNSIANLESGHNTIVADSKLFT